MERSEKIDELAVALAKAQAQIGTAHKDSTNPYFESKYADYAAVKAACQEHLSTNGLSYSHLLSNDAGETLSCTTILMHTSGQYLASKMTLKPTQTTPHAFGSCATYMKRYMLLGIVGIATDDDDANQASFSPKSEARGATGHEQLASTMRKAISVFSAPKEEDKTSSNPAPTPAEIFNGASDKHANIIRNFLASKNAVHLLPEMMKRMVSKELRGSELIKAFSAIDPEAPDFKE